MEEICTNLSAQLCDAGTGGYKIYYEEELLDALPEDMRNRETLEAALKNLTGGGYIDVKYARGSTFCICSFKKYEPVVKEQPETEETTDTVEVLSAPSIPKKFYAISALCAFAGGAVGGCVAAVLGAVL
ncbi:MAG: hypothetical protein K2I17_02255 [Clostridia bacterium]|nr:hypothetical protein [Clostridia bacterium]